MKWLGMGSDTWTEKAKCKLLVTLDIFTLATKMDTGRIELPTSRSSTCEACALPLCQVPYKRRHEYYCFSRNTNCNKNSCNWRVSVHQDGLLRFHCALTSCFIFWPELWTCDELLLELSFIFNSQNNFIFIKKKWYEMQVTIGNHWEVHTQVWA